MKTKNAILTNSIKLIIFALVITGLMGCKKEAANPNCETNCRTFEGTVLDPTNKVPLSAEISLTHHSGGSSLSYEEPIGTFLSDENGAFSFAIDGDAYKNRSGYFELKASKETYLSESGEGRIVFDSLLFNNFNIPLKADLLLRPKAEIEFQISTNNPVTNGDFDYSFQSGTLIHAHGATEKTMKYENSFVHEVGGDQEWIIRYSYKKGEIKGSETVFIEAGTRKIIVIEAL